LDQAYWDRVAGRFDSEVLKILERDRNGTLSRTLRDLASKRKRVADFGCGNGSLLPILSAVFRDVSAIDFSRALLSQAQTRTTDSRNITFHQADLVRPIELPHKIDVSVCVNVLLSPDAIVREAILENVTRALKRRGKLLLVVPAYESLLHTYTTIIQTNVDLGDRRQDAVLEVQAVYEEEVVSPLEGTVVLGTEPTKLHTRESIESAILDQGLRIDRVDRIEYPWSEMIDDAPEDLGAPYPWDWLVLARKP
tara:strand:- start:2531 stop:3286 length:756 start_codon:yes stop_codon:yes gene_type:complete